MNYYITVPILAFSVNLLVMIYVFALDMYNPINRAYAIFSACLSAWVGSTIGLYIPGSGEYFRFFAFITVSAWTLTGFTFLNFTYKFIGRPRDIIYYAHSVTVIVFFIIGNTTDLVNGGPGQFSWGTWMVHGPLCFYSIFLCIGLPAMYSLWLLFRHRNAFSDPWNRWRINVILAGIIIGFSTGYAAEFIIPNIPGCWSGVRYSPSTTIIVSLFMAYAIIKYRFLTPSIKDIANDLFVNLNDSVLIVDGEGKVLNINNAGCALLDVKNTENLKVDLNHLIINYSFNKDYDGYETTVVSGKSLRNVLITQSSISGGKYNQCRILIIKDITERKKLFEQVVQSEERFRAIVENVSDIIFMVDASGVINYVSPACERIGGYKPEELIGKSFTDYLYRNNLTDDMQLFRDTLRGEVKTLEFPIIAKNGELRNVICSSTPIITDGKVKGLHAVMTDITQIKLYKKEIEENEKRLSLIMNNITDMVWTIHLSNMKVTFASSSSEKVIGWKSAELISMNMDAWIEPDSLLIAREYLDDEISHDHERDPMRSRIFTFIVIHKDGRRLICEATLSFIRDSKRRPVEVLGVARDITERIRLQDELQHTLSDLKSRNDTIEEELVTAQVIQHALLPNESPKMDRLFVSFRHHPLDAIGGDYFNFMPMRENGLCAFIGDVSGHGVPAALFLSLIKSVTTNICRKYYSDPSQYLGELNRELCGNMQSHFLTAQYCVFTIPPEQDKKIIFSFANGGHPYPVIHRVSTGEVSYLEARGALLGKFKGNTYKTVEYTLEPGDRIFLYTDGLAEVMDSNRGVLGFDALLGIIRESSIGVRALDAVLDSVIDIILAYRKDTLFADDIILIGFEVI